MNSFAEKDKRIVLVSNEKNSGLAYSLNHCLSLAKGTYIARQDDDDISLPWRFEKEVTFLEEHKDYSLVGSGQLMTNGEQIWGKQILKESPSKEDLLFGCPFAHPTIMFTKKMIDAVGGYSTGKYISRAEDYDLYCKMFENGFKGYNLQEFDYLYYQTAYTYSKQKLKHRFDEFHLRNMHFKKLGILKGHRMYLIKPIISGLTPRFIRSKIHNRQFGLSEKEKKELNQEYQAYLR